MTATTCILRYSVKPTACYLPCVAATTCYLPCVMATTCCLPCMTSPHVTYVCDGSKLLHTLHDGNNLLLTLCDRNDLLRTLHDGNNLLYTLHDVNRMLLTSHDGNNLLPTLRTSYWEHWLRRSTCERGVFPSPSLLSSSYCTHWVTACRYVSQPGQSNASGDLFLYFFFTTLALSLIHISEPTRR